MLSDILYALRGFRRAPSFALVAVASLALGIGANTAIFTLLNAVVLRTLAVPEPNRLVLVSATVPGSPGYGAISYWHYQQLRDKNTVLSGLAAVVFLPQVIVGIDGSTALVSGEIVSGNYFDVLQTQASIGRLLTPDDDLAPGGHPVCVISYGLWKRQFGANPSVVGSTIQLNRRPYTILGVMPEQLANTRSGVHVDVRIPLMMADDFLPGHPLKDPTWDFLQPIGRMKPGVTIEQSRAALAVLFGEIEAARPTPRFQGKHPVVIVDPGAGGFTRLLQSYERPLMLLMAVVGLVLLIACANVANLMMARSLGRRREITVRLALGASRARLIRQLLSESLVLAMAGASAGTIIAWVGDRSLVAMLPHTSFGSLMVIPLTPDWRVLTFTLGLAVLVGILFGLAPAIQTTQPELRPGLQSAFEFRRFSISRIMVVAQIALSLILLVGMSFFLLSLRNLRSIQTGFKPDHVVMMSFDMADAGYSDAANLSFLDLLLERAKSLPGVVSTAPAVVSPLAGVAITDSVSVPGQPASPGEGSRIWMNFVGPEFFTTVGMPLVAGRVFTDRDRHSNHMAVVVNRKAATHFWPNESPIGRHVTIGTMDCEVVGVVQDAKYSSLREDAPATGFLPINAYPLTRFVLHTRITGDPGRVIGTLTHVVRELAPNLPVYNVTTMDAQLDNSIAPERLMATLTELFGLLAMILAAAGLYGMMAYMVVSRTREIGIRMALGAERRNVLGQVISEATVLTAVGLTLGLIGSLWAGRAVGSFLYDLSSRDPWMYVLPAILLAGISICAVLVPAWRASRIDPMVALRHE